MTPSEFIGKFKSRYLWGNLLAMAIVTGVLFIGVKYGLDVYTHHGEAILVPDLRKKDIGEAEKLLTHLGMEMMVSDTGYVKTLPPDCVLEQNLEPGERVKSGHVIYLVINSSKTPTLSLPDIVDNSSLREAMAKLVSMGFKLGQPKLVPGEKDWVYDVLVNGKSVAAGDKVSVEDALVIVAGNGRIGEDDSMNIVDGDEFGGGDDFFEASDDEYTDDFETVETQKQHNSQTVERQKEEPKAKEQQQENSNVDDGPVVRRIN